MNVDDGESWVSFTTAPSHLASLVSLVRDAFGSARFEPGPVGRRRELSATSFDSPTYRQAAHERFLHNGAIYGSVPALSQRRTPQTERSLSVELLRAQSARCFQPPNLVLALTGNLTEASVREAVAPLGTLAGKTQVTHLAAGKPPGARTVWLAPARLDSRVQVTFIGPGLAPGSRERAAATVLLALLIDHVTWELRSQFGFVYSVDGAFEVGPGTGALWLRFTTRADVAFEAVRRALQLLQDWWDRWPLDPEVTARLAKSTREKAQRVPAPQRAFDAARARMQDGERFDDRTFVQQLDDLRAHQLSALFVRALAPERLQILVSGALDTRLDWKQFGKVVLAPVP